VPTSEADDYGTNNEADNRNWIRDTQDNNGGMVEKVHISLLGLRDRRLN
jgi:hypothetical protein